MLLGVDDRLLIIGFKEVLSKVNYKLSTFIYNHMQSGSVACTQIKTIVDKIHFFHVFAGKRIG